MGFGALRCTNFQYFRFALIWPEIASLYEFVGAVKRLRLSDERASNRHKNMKMDRNLRKLVCNVWVFS